MDFSACEKRVGVARERQAKRPLLLAFDVYILTREKRVGVARERQAKRPLLLAFDVLDFIKVLPFSSTCGKSSGVFASHVRDAKSLIQVGPEATIQPSVFSRTEWSRRQD